MITAGSISPAALAGVFPGLVERFPGRRAAIKEELTHGLRGFPRGRIVTARGAGPKPSQFLRGMRAVRELKALPS